jgi:hypothetical protein
MALRIAWWCWLSMLALPFIAFIVTIWAVNAAEGADESASTFSRVWFYASMGYMLVAVPISFFWRSHVFRDYWAGHCVSPSSYLRGMIPMWIIIEIGGLLSLVGCILSGALLPNLLPALVAFMLFVPLWPSGRAMLFAHGATDDPELYSEPR